MERVFISRAYLAQGAKGEGWKIMSVFGKIHGVAFPSTIHLAVLPLRNEVRNAMLPNSAREWPIPIWISLARGSWVPPAGPCADFPPLLS